MAINSESSDEKGLTLKVTALEVGGIAVVAADLTGAAALAAATPGTVTASKAVVVDANKHQDVCLVSASGLKIGASGSETAVTASAAELNKLAGVTGGTVAASKAVVVDANKHQDVCLVSASGLKIGTSGSETAVTATAAELNVTAGVTAGTVIASKAIVTDANTAITGLKQVTLAAGTATVAPIILTSGTNLTTAAAGAIEFDGSIFYSTALASTRQVALCEQFICSSSDSTTYNNTGLDSNAAYKVFMTPSSGQITLAASTTYFFEAMYHLSNTGTTSHTWGTLFAVGGSLTGIRYTALAYTGVTSGVTITACSALQVGVATVVPVTAASTSATEFVTIVLKGVVRTNAAGTFVPQLQASARPGASGTPGVTVLNGSYFRIWPVGTNAVTSVGNWA